jgi:hypothetical protein
MGDSNMSQSQKHSQIPKPKKMYVNFCSYHTERGFFCHFCNAVLVLQNSPVLPRMPMNTIYIYINKSVQYFKYLHRTLTSRLKTSQYHFIWNCICSRLHPRQWVRCKISGGSNSTRKDTVFQSLQLMGVQSEAA